MQLLIVLGVFGLVAPAFGGRLAPNIIGGVEASIGAWPWQGSLQYRSGSHSCGCSLISDMWVITAAHCIHDMSPSQMQVVMGLHDRGNTNVGKPATYYFRSIILHPRYDDWTLENDIALLLLTKRVTMNEYVQSVALAPSGANFDNQWCYITGWGVTTEDGGYLANRLQEARVQVYTQQDCSEHWFVKDSLICVGVMHEKGSCNGDSGGPLSCSVGGKYQLAGLTSFGTVGCRTSKPSVYTRVSYYRDWIRDVTGI